MMYIWSQVPVHPSSGDYWNPANWVEFVKVVGVPAVFALLLFGYIVWKEWRGWNQPSNLAQVRLLKFLYRDANARNERLRMVLRSFCEVVAAFAKKADVAVDDKLSHIQDALDKSPPVPDELMLEEEKK